MPVSSRSIQTAFSLRRQADVRTEVAVANVNKKRATIDFGPSIRNRAVSVNDQAWYGRGNNFASFNELLAEDFTLGQRQVASSELDLLHGMGYVVGAHSAVNTSGAVWRHDLTWADITTSPEVDYTTLHEQMGTGSAPGHKKLLEGVWFDQIQIVGAFGDFIRQTVTGRFRRFADVVATLPAVVTPSSLFVINRTIMSFGLTGAEVVVDGEWTAFDLTFNQNGAIKRRSGQPVGQEELIERTDRGDQTLTGSISLEFDSAKRAHFLGEVDVGIIIEMVSKDLVDATPKSAKIIIPRIRIESEDFSEEDRTTIWTPTLNEGSVLDIGGANEPFKMEIVTDIDDTEMFVV